MSSSLVWLIGAMVCPCAAPRDQLFVSADNGWPQNALRYHSFMPISCYFRDCCNGLLVTSCVSTKQCYSNYPDLYFYLYHRSITRHISFLSLFARDSIYAKRAYAIAIPSVRLSVRPSVRLSVRPSVRHTGDSCKNGCS